MMLVRWSANKSVHYSEMAPPALSNRENAKTPTADAQSSRVETSSLLDFSTRCGLSDVTVQGSASSLVYRQDGSLALQARTSFNASLRRQETSIAVTLPAEALGKDIDVAAFKDGPIQFQFTASLTTVDVQRILTARTVKTARKPEAILSDIINAIREALQRRGEKQIRLVLDQDAVKALQVDPKIREAMQDITALLLIINTLSDDGKGRDDYTIQVSGKGKPYQDVQENVQVESLSQELNVHLTILPPVGEGGSPTPSDAPTGEQESL